MEHEPNALEQALIRAATEPAERPAFYRLLMESEVFVLGHVQGDAGSGRRTVNAGEQVQLVNWQKQDGTRVLPFFASLPALQRAITEQQPYLAMPARSLFELTRGATLVLNPASGHAKEFVPHEVEALLATGLNQVPQTRVVEKETRVLLGQPAEYPAEMVSALTTLLARHPAVKAAYLCLMHDPSTRVPVDFILMKPTGAGIEPYLRNSVKPFYERTWGSKLKSIFGSGRA